MHRLFAGICVAAIFHGTVLAADFAPADFKLQRGQPNQLLVLGTPHLSQLPKSFDPAILSLLLERLAGWQPPGGRRAGICSGGGHVPRL